MTDMLGLLGFHVGVWLDYGLAGLLAALGAYLVLFMAGNPLAGPLRFLGMCSLAAGVLIAGYALGKENGASAVEAEWKAKNLEARLARAEQERDAQERAASFAATQIAALNAVDVLKQGKVSDYANAVADLQESVRACRRASDDDVRRLCDLTGNAAPGCSHP